MRPPRKALASTGSTAGGAFLRASQRSIAPSRRPPSIGAPKAASGATRSAALRRTSNGMPKICICATLTRVVITATHRPARTPTPTASAVRPSSLARKRARTVAYMTSAGRGTEIRRARRSPTEPMFKLMHGARPPCQGRAAGQVPESAMSSRWIISARPGGPEDMRDVARIAAADALGVQRVIGDEAAADLGAVLVADRHAIAAREHALDARDARRQQAFAAGERRAAPASMVIAPLGSSVPPIQTLRAASASRASETRCMPPPRRRARSDGSTRPSAITICAPA